VETLKKALNNFELYLGALCSGTMICILFAQVVARYVFSNAFAWAEEIALVLFVLSVYFGATAAILRNQHLRIEIVLGKLKPVARKKLEIFNCLMFIGFNIIMLQGIMPIVTRLYNSPTALAVTGIPKWIFYAFLPALFCLMIIRLLQSCYIKYKEVQELSAGADSSDTK